MTTLTYSKLVEQADALEAEEQLRLAAYLLERVRQTVSRDKPKRKWAEVCGLYPYPMLGEDAQEWVDLQLLSRGRIPPTLEDLENLRDVVYTVDLGRKNRSSTQRANKS